MNTQNGDMLSEAEIDALVTAQADDDAAWEAPVHVQHSGSVSITLPGRLAARAAFLAQLHGEAQVEDWLKRIIQERIAFEEAAFADLKRTLVTHNNE